MNTATEPIFPADARARLSLCMIVKNEARCLARALRSAAPWVGEIVVVDTGSTDETVAIAEAAGARVVHVPWTDDFSAARNASLEAATRPWALIMDADEELVMSNPAALVAALAQDAIAGFDVTIENMLDDGSTQLSPVFRLIRRDLPGMRYVGVIHEQLVAVRDRAVATSALSGVALRHDGYLTAVQETQNKAERNVPLCRRMVEESPESAFAWFNLGVAIAGTDRAEARRAYGEALERLRAAGSLPNENWVLFLVQANAQELVATRDETTARTLVEEGLRCFTSSPDLHLLRGQLRYNAGQYEAAAEDFEFCLSPEARRTPLIAIPGAAGYAAETWLALAWLQLGRAEQAEAAFARAAVAAPASYVLPRASLGMILLQRGEWAQALRHLQAMAMAAPQEQEPRFKLGWCLYQLERYEEAEAALTPVADMPRAQELLGKVLLEMGEGQRALHCLDACKLPSAGLAAGWAAYLTGAAERAAGLWAEWLRAGAADWGTKDTLSRFLFLLQGGTLPKGEPERPAEPLRDMDRWFRLFLRFQRYDEVETLITRGPRLGSRLWHPLRKMWGITLVKEGFRDVGTALLLEAQSAQQEDAEIYYWLGVSALEQRLPEEAQSLWRTCLLLAPNHPQARQALSLLN